MPSTSLSAYEFDVAGQPEAMIRVAEESSDGVLPDLDLTRFDRIILTGMGSSDSVAIPFEIAIARRGLPVLRIQTSNLLEMPELITPSTLLWITSQSRRSGEIVAALPVARAVGARIVAMTNDSTSPLALAADHVLELSSGARRRSAARAI